METIRVLLVDDEDDFRTTLANRLRKRKLEVAEAESGSSALNLLGQGTFDVVVLDVRMPGMDGIETLKQIKGSTPLVEVIMLTGHASVESGIEGMRLGAFDYLMKPCDINDLISKIMDAYQRLLLQKEST
jgi:two-component system, OmpR family, response regulator